MDASEPRVRHRGFFLHSESGEADSGIAAHLLGTVPSVVFGGVVSLLVVGIVALTVPRLRRLRDLESVVPE